MKSSSMSGFTFLFFIKGRLVDNEDNPLSQTYIPQALERIIAYNGKDDFTTVIMCHDDE